MRSSLILIASFVAIFFIFSCASKSTETVKTEAPVKAEEAKKFLDAFLLLPITIIHPTDEIIWNVAEMKAEHSISLADCFAAVTAIEKGAVILSGDPDFKKIEHVVRIEWM